MRSGPLFSRLTFQLGCIFLVLVLSVIGVIQFQDALANQWRPAPWLVVLVTIGCGGFVSLRISRTTGQIEGELLRRGGPAGQTTDPLRPMVGAGPVVNAWNTLIEQARLAERRHFSEANGMYPDEADSVRARSVLGDASADASILLARAVRSMTSGLVVTDLQSTILVANQPAMVLLSPDREEGRVPTASLAAANIENSPSADEGRAEMLPSEEQCSPAESDDELWDEAMLDGKSLADRLSLLSVLMDPAEPNSASEVELRERAAQAIERLQQGGGAVTVRLPVGTLEDPQTLRITRSRLQGRQDDVTGYVWVLQDITQQTLAELSRDQFLQTATHELRTPLANLLAYSETLRIEDGISVEEQKEFCNIITEEAQRLNRLVDNLLSVGQLEAGSMVVSDQRVEFARVLDEAIDNARPQILANQLTLQTDISPKLKNVRGDKEKLQAMLVNLIGNAAKYTPEGGLVRIVAKMREDWLEVSIEDTGIGIGPEDLPKIFDKFYRVQNDQVLGKSGNGLGLAFAREVARLHHGDIAAESRLGEGSVFTVRLPAPDELEVGG